MNNSAFIVKAVQPSRLLKGEMIVLKNTPGKPEKLRHWHPWGGDLDAFAAARFQPGR